MWIFGVMFAAGLCLAGSDGDWFPWINMVGMVMIGIVGIFASCKRP